ncbi:MAG: TRAP transporter fused permease subunit [Tissierellales bacterium]|nr:TRAP transporter fused permease subunit [Tissierellales bacterium]
MLKYLIDSGEKRQLSPLYTRLRHVLVLITSIYLVVAVLIYPEPIFHRAISFGLFFAYVFLSYTTPGSISKKVPFYDIVLSVASLAVSVYIGYNLDRIIHRYINIDPVMPLDLLFGFLTIFLLIEGTRRVTGPWLSLLNLMALLYILFGHHIPGKFGHRGFTTSQIIDGLFLSPYGIWGGTLGVATGHIMIFLIFGAFFIKSGAGRFLFDFVSSLAGSSKGGVAKIAIISSALFGMISGSPIANASTTGAMTIPTMIKRGYSPEFAASVESCASVGGIFMPPIMGSVAFMMSEVVGIPYAKVASSAFFPAFLYFAALFFTIDIRSRKIGIGGMDSASRKPLFPLLRQGTGFFIPLFYLIFRLMSGVSPSKVGLESVLLILVISLFSRDNRISFKGVFDAFSHSIDKGVVIVSTMASCGIMIGVVNITGIAAKFSSSLISISSISVMFTLVLVMLITLFLGLAMNITSSYLITAVICAPILIRLGYAPLSVHMFILFFAAMATVTPPVALTSFAAATIAGASPMRVGFQSMKMGIIAYILPFIFIFNPAVLLLASKGQIIFSVLSAFVGVALIALGMEGWWFDREVNLIYRLVIFAAGLLAVLGQVTFTLTSAAVVFLVFLYYRSKPRRGVN